MWNLKYGTNEPIYKKEMDLQTQKTDLLPVGMEEWEFGVNRCKLLHLEWVNNKILLESRKLYLIWDRI